MSQRAWNPLDVCGRYSEIDPAKHLCRCGWLKSRHYIPGIPEQGPRLVLLDPWVIDILRDLIIIARVPAARDPFRLERSLRVQFRAWSDIVERHSLDCGCLDCAWFMQLGDALIRMRRI